MKNFRNMAAVFSTLQIDISKPYGVALIHAVLKIDRLNNLLNKNTPPSNESLQDTIDDLKNYVDLMEACLIDAEMTPIDKGPEATKALYHLLVDRA